MKPAVIISTYPDKKSITKIAKVFVKNKTVACVNISKISSIYSWNKKIENTSEYIAIFKTTSKNKKLLKEKIKETHPYDVPEIAEIDQNIHAAIIKALSMPGSALGQGDTDLFTFGLLKSHMILWKQHLHDDQQRRFLRAQPVQP